MIAIKVPLLGESIVEATVGRWLKEEGEAVTRGEPLVELETDKVNVEVPAPQGGVLVKQLRKTGDVVAVDETIAEVDETAAAPAVAAPQAEAAPAAAATPKAAPAAAAPATPTAPQGRAATGARGPARTSPSARRMAAEEQMDVSQVAGTGRDGRVTKADVIAAKSEEAGRREKGATVPEERAAPYEPVSSLFPAPSSPASRETRQVMSTRRRRMAEHLLEAQHATAHLTTFNEVDMSAVMAVRAHLKDRVEKEHGVRLTYMPFFVKAACLALQSYPTVNAQVDGDAILFRNYVNMGIAVAADEGLVVPVVRDADRKGMLDVSREIAALAQRARDGKLTMDDLTGGTFTITNGGVFGSLVSTPILNYPQVGILGLHKIQERPVAISGAVEIRPMMYLALSYDHRIVEGQHAVLFLVRVKELLEDPASMLIE
ncbi:MAG TPA: 2-oxoglutarate dehydrogenase complex dihydrolipoyllysine-residue succinyltransferase [Gemmatimonadaceae bacterium]|nr:2-oxoglutarate dehydrogenase complex dihydrolipoyllysine-residue succinyltransferase [Gemmatimonadaceae bacterium]